MLRCRGPSGRLWFCANPTPVPSTNTQLREQGERATQACVQVGGSCRTHDFEPIVCQDLRTKEERRKAAQPRQPGDLPETWRSAGIAESDLSGIGPSANRVLPGLLLYVAKFIASGGVLLAL